MISSLNDRSYQKFLTGKQFFFQNSRKVFWGSSFCASIFLVGLGAGEEDALGVKLEHGVRVLAVGGDLGRVLDVEFEADIFDDAVDDVVSRLDARLAGNVGEVVQERPQVDPVATCNGEQNTIIRNLEQSCVSVQNGHFYWLKTQFNYPTTVG